MNKIPDALAAELAALAGKSDEDIDFSDIPETSAAGWNGAARGRFYKPIKQQLTVRIDADVLHWLRRGGAGYQKRLNSILRQAMLQDASQAPAQKER